MSQCMSSLNPPKTLINPKISIKKPSFPSIFTFKTRPRFQKLTTISASVMPSQNQDHPPLSLDSLISSSRKDELFGSIKSSLSNCLSETNLHLTVPGLKSKTRGKVRDIYDSGDYLVLVTTDRQSAFDRILASIPFKGQVLNETSLWWFDKTRHITSNAVVSSPDKNVTIAKKCSVFPVEFVASLGGSCDAFVSQIVKRGLMTQADYDEASRKALSLFEYGQHIALEHGLILVDTKYEFGKANDGSVVLIDEVHTPDSSRYWIANSYDERFQNGLEPENVDKEFLRLWFKDHCNPYEDEVLPDAPADLVCELAWRYIFLYETITKSKFEMPLMEEPIHDRISQNVARSLASLQ
ncbi:phosphoribosylaminoimidazole-succinocarboxamide synthase, chloroplastic isoform X2 [Quercus lobata]|uniref:phosphoribosylaminoimidazole-succinocarboxamide synthase, chloroplastic isoform X2 n=1 Tax=Quercus lobata TaxID=97700 RepID=UPI001246FA1F|nr:phosphoribosylaminoimidazole-succinocarboxamide synthase, chloroplastic isoform X2 [Quercus lobata]